MENTQHLDARFQNYKFANIIEYTTSGDTIWDSDIVWDTLNMCHFLL